MADPGFPRGGRQSERERGCQPFIRPKFANIWLAKFSEKLHEIERIWTPGRARPSQPLRSATIQTIPTNSLFVARQILQSHLFTLKPYWVHEKNLLMTCRWLAQKKWYEFSVSCICPHLGNPGSATALFGEKNTSTTDPGSAAQNSSKDKWYKYILPKCLLLFKKKIKELLGHCPPPPPTSPPPGKKHFNHRSYA